MPKVICEWDTCKHCSVEGYCENPDEIKLTDVVVPGKGSLMDCKSFEWAEEEK